MQRARLKRFEFCIPYGGITRIRFIGTLSILPGRIPPQIS